MAGNDKAGNAASPACVKARSAAATAATCIICRSRHVKCDGHDPCARCVSSGQKCRYIASRRGCRTSRKDGAPTLWNKGRTFENNAAVDWATMNAAACQDRFGSEPSDTTTSSTADGLDQNVAHLYDSQVPILSPLNLQMEDLFNDITLPNNAMLLSTISDQTNAPLVAPDKADSTQVSAQDQCVEAFYYYFFASHPFVLPRGAFLWTARNDNLNLSIVMAAMQWIGSLYLHSGSTEQDRLYEKVNTGVTNPGTPRDGFLVQALMLLAIGLDGQGQQDRARQHLLEAQGIALEIQLNVNSFAEMNGRASATLAESWRRTWWELYVVDAMVSGVHRTTNFALFDVVSDVDIPCEEHEYTFENIPRPMTLQDILDTDFTDLDRPISSFGHRILSCRNLGHFMRTPQPIIDANDANLAKLEARLTNWRLHLPHAKQDAVRHDGSVDEMVFQAQMMMHATSILLHQSHAHLDASATEHIDACAPQADGRRFFLKHSFNIHTKHTVTSAAAISDMVTMHAPLVHHTHFFSCVVTLSSIVHLSYWAHYCGYDNDGLKQQIRLNIGALQHLSQVWKTAETAYGQVKSVARDVFRARRQQQQEQMLQA